MARSSSDAEKPLATPFWTMNLGAKLGACLEALVVRRRSVSLSRPARKA